MVLAVGSPVPNSSALHAPSVALLAELSFLLAQAGARQRRGGAYPLA